MWARHGDEKGHEKIKREEETTGGKNWKQLGILARSGFRYVLGTVPAACNMYVYPPGGRAGTTLLSAAACRQLHLATYTGGMFPKQTSISIRRINATSGSLVAHTPVASSNCVEYC